jgi:hypothetical protein
MTPPASSDTPDTPAEGTLLFGYTHVSGVPLCPCRDPGNYMCAHQGPGPLDVVFRCWCGATMAGTFDDTAERSEMLSRYGGRPGT